MFSSLSSKVLWSRIDSCYSILFSNLKQKKEQNIIIGRVISSCMGPMYIEIPYIWFVSENFVANIFKLARAQPFTQLNSFMYCYPILVIIFIKYSYLIKYQSFVFPQLNFFNLVSNEILLFDQ